MSFNQSRANKNESHYRKTGRSGNSAQPRVSSGRGGKGGSTTGLPPSSSSFSSNRSFKKSNGQGAHWVTATKTNSDLKEPIIHTQSPLSDALDTSLSEASTKQSDSSSQRSRSSRAIPKAPSSQSTYRTKDSTAPTSTPKDDASSAFPLQFGSFVNGVQLPVRTSSAPPNLDEKKHEQVLHDSFRSGPTLHVSSTEKEQPPRKDVQQFVMCESPPPPQAKKDLQAAPSVTNPQSSSALSFSGESMAVPLQQKQVPISFSVPSPQIQAQGVTSMSSQMPMTLPVGNSAQVQQQVFIPGFHGHHMQHQGIVHQGHGLNFSPHMGHQTGSQLGNLSFGINPQFAQRQSPRRTVKITHPETHEELKFDKRTEMNLDGGSLGPRSHLSLQSHPIAYAPTHQINYYSHIQPNPAFFQTSLPLTGTEMTSQASRIKYPVCQVSEIVSFANPSALRPFSGSKTGPGMHWIADSSNLEHTSSAQALVSAPSSALRQVTVKPAPGSFGEKVGSSLVPANSHADDNSEMLKSTVSFSPSITTEHPASPSAASQVEKFPPSTSNFPPTVLTGEIVSVVNNTEGRRDPLGRSNSIKHALKEPSKKDQQHYQLEVPFSKMVEPTPSSLTCPSEGVVFETTECKATPASTETCEDVLVTSGESLPTLYEGVGSSSVVETDNVQVDRDSTYGSCLKSGAEYVPVNSDDVQNLEQGNCTLPDIQLKGVLVSEQRGDAELSEQPQLDKKYIDHLKIKKPTDSSSLDSSKVGSYSEQDFSSLETTVHSGLKNEAWDPSLKIDKTVSNLVSSTDPSSVPNVSEINPYDSVLPANYCKDKPLTLEGFKSGSVCLDSKDIPVFESGKTHQESSISTSFISASFSELGENISENGLVRFPPSGSKDNHTLGVEKVKNTSGRGRRRRKEILQKADAAGTTSDLYMAYKGSHEKPEPAISLGSIDNTSGIDVRQISPDVKVVDVFVSKEDGHGEAEPDDWEDAVVISSGKLKISDTGEQVHGGLQCDEEDVKGATGKRKYSRDFLLTFSGQCTDLPAGFEIKYDIAEALMGSKVSILNHVDGNPYSSSGRLIDRRSGASRSDQRGSGMVGVDRWHKSPGSFSSGHDPLMDISQGGIVVGFRSSPGSSHRVPRNMQGQPPGQYVGGILSGPLLPLVTQGGIQQNGSDGNRWPRAIDIQRGWIPSPPSPLQIMHKAVKKYEVCQVSDEEEAKQRQLKGILNKLTPQNFEKLFEKVKSVNIDNAGTLAGVISQIFDKALMEPTFCEMYANFCYHLAGELPDFIEGNEKITFKRLLLNKCQEEFERGEREQEEANRVEGDGEVKQSEQEKEEKKIRARRRMLGNIRLIGELYKKKMLTERIMHECIKKLLGQHQNPDEEDLEALCKLMSTIGEMIDHPKAKEYMDAYFDMIMNLSNNMKLSSRMRFMLKDVIDLRNNKWRQRRKVEGPKKIEEVHRDAAQERQAQGNRLARGSNNSLSARRGQTLDYSPRGSSMSPSQNTHMGSFRGFSAHVRGFSPRDVRLEDRYTNENRMPPVSMQHRNRDSWKQSFDRSMEGPPSPCVQEPSPVTQNVPSHTAWPEERLRAMSVAAIREFYSANDMNEVALCVKDMNSPSFHSSMICIWITDSFERKDRDRDLLAKLLVTLTKSTDRLLTAIQLTEGVESVLATLEDAVTDAPKAAEFLGRVLGKVIAEDVVSLREIGKLIREGGEEHGRLLQTGIGYKVIGSAFEMIRSEKGESFLSAICTSSNTHLEDFCPPNPAK